MKRDSFFIAVSRGKTYDGAALAKALDEKRLAGAGLDVTDPEPLPPNSPLWEFDNVVITPHIAGQSDKFPDRQLAVFNSALAEGVGTDVALKRVVDHLVAETLEGCMS